MNDQYFMHGVYLSHFSRAFVCTFEYFKVVKRAKKNNYLLLPHQN